MISYSRFLTQHLKVLLLLVLVLNFQPPEESRIYEDYFERDLNLCPSCFQNQLTDCYVFLNKSTVDVQASFTSGIINLLSTCNRNVRQMQYENKQIVAKYFAQNVDQIRQLSSKPLNSSFVANRFLDAQRLDGLQYCPSQTIARFVSHLKSHTNHKDDLTIWLYLLINVQPILVPYLHAKAFPVPRSFASCGFTIFEEHAGTTLTYFRHAHFKVKLKIARQLLEAALKFTQGFNEFRLYVTDLNADNVAYNEEFDKLYLIDLDTLLIVDAKASTVSKSTHKHEYIECDNCFAYSPQDICAHEQSDINLFAACQFLREDLSKNRDGGFLQPIPEQIIEAYPNLLRLLDECVDGENSRQQEQRFTATLDIIDIIEKIILHFY